MTEDTQAELLKRLADDFGMSIAGAQGLSGGALDAWLDRAEDACMWVVQIWEPEGTQRRPSSWSPSPDCNGCFSPSCRGGRGVSWF